MRRRWPWFAWGALGVALELFALSTDSIDPLTRVVGWVRSTWPGRLLYAAARGMWDQHVDET